MVSPVALKWGQLFALLSTLLLVFPLSSEAWTREYTLVCQEKILNMDGTSKLMMTFNGTVPGPLLTAVEGDTIKVTLINNCAKPVTVHFHGMRQKGTPFMDGVPGLSQCAVGVGKTFVYTFKADPAGTSWYHSHQGVEYMEGLFGPLLISHKANSGISYASGVDQEFLIMFQDL